MLKCTVSFVIRQKLVSSNHNKKIHNPDIRTTLPQMVDDVITSCPIDTRRKLYNNIVLSGGNTVFKDFSRRLQRDVKKKVEE